MEKGLTKACRGAYSIDVGTVQRKIVNTVRNNT